MPKKSDRPRHGSTMSNLLPNVDLDPDAPESAENEDSTTEEQNYSSTEEQKSSAASPQNAAPSASPMLPVHPETRPDLSTKLGPYVSDATSDALEEVFLQMRRHYGSDVSKSLIVEAALRYLLSDTLQHGTESELAHWLDQTLTE
jgi:hypothetical protein